MTTTSVITSRRETVRSIAKEAYVFGYPLVDGYRVLHSFFVDSSNKEYKGGWNRLAKLARVFTPEDTVVQTPNSDTPYCTIGLDLRSEPFVLSIPKIDKSRYFSIQLVDAFTFNFAYIGTRTGDLEGGHFLIHGPSWKPESDEDLKAFSRVISSETDLVLGIYRTQLFNPEDIGEVKKIFEGYTAQPLSEFLGKRCTEIKEDLPKIDYPAIHGEQLLKDPEFFNILSFILGLSAVHPSETEIIERMRSIGIGPGMHIDFSALDETLVSEFKAGMLEGHETFKKFCKDEFETGRVQTSSFFGDRATLKNNYLYRMAGCVFGIFGNSPQEALYPMFSLDSNKMPLNAKDGAVFTLTFDAGLPPVDAFWSITIYDEHRLLVKNPINRYLINSTMEKDLVKDEQNRVVIYIQHQEPEKDLVSNWLPAPDGPFLIVLRLYNPKLEAVEGLWKAPEPERQLSYQEIRDVAKEAYVYGYPIVDNYRVMHSFFTDRTSKEYKGGWNFLAKMDRVFTPEDRVVQTPNSDTPYCMLGLNLRAEPWVLSIPSIQDRYFSIQLVDGFTFNFDYIGTRMGDVNGGNFLIHGPNWRGEIPAEIEKSFNSETDLVFAIYRTQLFHPEDIEAVRKIFESYTAVPLSKFLQESEEKVSVEDPVISYPPVSSEEMKSSPEFFNVLSYALSFASVHSTEEDLFKRFNSIGIKPGNKLDFDSMRVTKKNAFLEGIADGLKTFQKFFTEQIQTGKVNSTVLFGTRAHMKNNYLNRMSGAILGIYGNSADEALYIRIGADSNKKVLDGAGGASYALKFDQGLPPVDAFWSITMYDQDKLLVKNMLNRYLINSIMEKDLVLNEKGQYVIYLQHLPVSQELIPNWLPAPESPFEVIIRLYIPKKEALEGTWRAPQILKL